MFENTMTFEEFSQKAVEAIQKGDQRDYMNALDCRMATIAKEKYDQTMGILEEMREDRDTKILSSRGVRQLTSKEREYYSALRDAMRAPSPKQALSDLDVVMPETVIDAVFDDLQESHPLLSRITFTPTAAAVRMLVNTNGRQEATWGELCDEIIKELMSGFKEIDTGMYKLSAFLPVCNAMLDLGPQWLDSYVRQILYEAIANGLEAGIVTGTGNKQPIGMDRDVSEGVSVSGGNYPKKAAIAVNSLDAATVGNLLSLLAIGPNGKTRTVQNVILIVNTQDYYQKVMPATTIMAPDGTYRNDVLPYPMAVIQTQALARGEALLGMSHRYFCNVGMNREGQIDYSDQYQFLEDNRVYRVKLYANGLPLDNNAFLRLDITGLTPKIYKVETVEAKAPSTDATLSALTIGALTLTPTFDPATTTYTAATINATNTITATPADAKAAIDIVVKDTDGSDQADVDNGTAATWYEGSNTVTITVTAEDGTTTKAYTVTVTKS